MPTLPLPFDESQIRELTAKYPTPFYIYDEAAIRINARRLTAAFAWCPGFCNHFAVKATPNPHLLRILDEEGFGTDCSSLPEVMLAEAAGITGERIFFTSNNTPSAEFVGARAAGAVLNLDDLTHVSFMAEHCGIPDLVSFRYNPGPLRDGVGNQIIGNPEDAKYGLTREQLFTGYKELKSLGVSRFGLHTMVVSNELKVDSFVETARMLFSLALELAETLDIRLEWVNLGGGIGIPYHPDEQPIDLESLGSDIGEIYRQMILPSGLDQLAVLIENGRVITGPSGYLVNT